jgi:hypothetical protein
MGASTTCTLTYYKSGTAGYVGGTNSYGDQEKSQKYSLSTYSLNTPATVSGGGAVFAVVTGTGTSTVKMKLYDDNAGQPGTLLATSGTVAITSIVAGTVTPFAFASPVTLPGVNFHISIDLTGVNAAAGDSVCLAETNDGCSLNTVDGAWEYQSSNTWVSFTNTTTAGWGFTSSDLAIFPQVTAETSVKNISLNASNVSVSPNPSNGLVNVSVAVQNKENLSISVSNALGQVIMSNNYSSISNETLSLDLSNQNNGIYFVSVSNGTEKTVKRVVLNK